MDNYSLFTLGEIEVNKKILQNYSLLPLSNGQTPSEFDKNAVESFSEIWIRNLLH